MLRFRVSETPDAEKFLTIGRDTAGAIRAVLERAGRPLEEFDSILDFGCGCGRTLLWLLQEHRKAALYGTDVDAEAIAWCRAHLPSAAFEVNRADPPMPFADASFDLVYGVSVLTHLSEEHQLRWLRDLRRVVKPGGLLLLSVHGESAWSGLAEEEVEELQRRGFLFKRSGKLRGILPGWYQTAYHSREYVERTFGRGLELVAYEESGMGYQDVVVLRRGGYNGDLPIRPGA